MAYRSADPVSISRFNVVSPTLTGVRYSLSSSSGLAMALPLSAASLMLWGTALPNFVNELAYIPGRLMVRPWVSGLVSCLSEKPLRGRATGTADTIADR